MPFDPAGFRHVTVSKGPKVTVLPPSLVPMEPDEGVIPGACTSAALWPVSISPAIAPFSAPVERQQRSALFVVPGRGRTGTARASECDR
jgi:hypothetical protein